MAALCDIFVHDAFGTGHRAEPRPTASRSSRRCLRRPAAAPRSIDHEGALRSPNARWSRSSPAARVSTKLTILQALAKNVDQLIVGGGIANTFMLAAGLPIGKSLAEADLSRGEGRDRGDEGARRRGADPVDVVTAKAFAPTRRPPSRRGRRRRRRPDPRHRPEDRARWPRS
jgi:phosphoglycerate kinase